MADDTAREPLLGSSRTQALYPRDITIEPGQSADFPQGLQIQGGTVDTGPNARQRAEKVRAYLAAQRGQGELESSRTQVLYRRDITIRPGQSADFPQGLQIRRGTVDTGPNARQRAERVRAHLAARRGQGRSTPG